MIEPIKIIDIINHKTIYSTQQFLVINRLPIFLYERKGTYLIAEDSGFFNIYGYETPGPKWKAFGGAKFDIPMINGVIIKANGQWWDFTPKDYQELVVHAAYGTIEALNRCNVFSGTAIDPVVLKEAQDRIAPSNNYNKYDTKHKDYRKQTIVSMWE